MIIQPQLKDWAKRNRDRYGFTIRQMADRSGISHSTVALFFKPEAKLGFDACLAMANLFNTPLLTVLEMAELIPPKPLETQELRLLTDIYHRLSGEDRKQLINFAEYLRDGKKAIATTETD